MSAAWPWASHCLPCKLGSWGGEGFVCSSHLVQEVAMRTVKQSSMVRETENGEEGEDEAAEFGEEDLFHQQVEVPRHVYACTHIHTRISQALFMQLPWASPRPQSSQQIGCEVSCPAPWACLLCGPLVPA